MADKQNRHALQIGPEDLQLVQYSREECDGVFERLYDLVRDRWQTHREEGRRPSNKNWTLRCIEECSPHPAIRLEKQLQRSIVNGLKAEGWRNDMPTASGLVNSYSRQMNIDLIRELGDGYEFIEVKIDADHPNSAALQILRYGAIYLLYRLEPTLANLFPSNEVLAARRIGLKVLAPRCYYDQAPLADLLRLQAQLDEQVRQFASERVDALEMSFQFSAFPRNFTFKPALDPSVVAHFTRLHRPLNGPAH